MVKARYGFAPSVNRTGGRVAGLYKLADKVELNAAGGVMTPEGFLDVRARISRAGIYEYLAGELYELFKDRDPNAIVRVYRPAEEVFKAASMQSFTRKPVTDGHPWENVNASNVHEHQVGFSGESMRQDGNYVTGQLLIQKAEAVNRVQRGERELSAGYEADITREAGLFEGESYDAVMRNIIGNHIALVDAGRCGAVCRVGDRAPPKRAEVSDCNCNKDKPPMNTPVQLQARTYDGLPIQVEANSAPIFDKMAAELASLKTKLDASDGKIAGMTATHKTEIDKLTADLADAKKGIPDAAAIEAMVTARTQVMTDAARLLPEGFDCRGKALADIRKAAVAAKLGDEAVAGKSEAYVEAMFDALAKVLPKDESTGNGVVLDSLQVALNNGNPPAPKADANKAYNDHLAWLQNAHKGEPVKA